MISARCTDGGGRFLTNSYEGMRQQDFGPALRLLRQGLDMEVGPLLKRPSAVTWITWMAAVGRKVLGTKALAAREAAGGGKGAAQPGGLSDGSGLPPMRARSEGPAAGTPGGETVNGAYLDAAVGTEGEQGSLDMLPLHLLDVNDAEYMQMLYELLRAKALVVKYDARLLITDD
jgi:hypothetical protein